MSYEEIKRWRHETKKRLVKAFGGECGICGYNKSIRSLSFHHLNPNEKEESFASSCKSWKRLANEAKKCVLLCSNCHMEVHDGITKIPDNIKRFDESYIEYRDTNLTDKCPVCGKEKSIKRKTCSLSCAGKKNSKVDWDSIDLQKMYNDIGSYKGVGEILNITGNSVKKRMKKMNMLL